MNELISVLVVSYNSEKYIVELLESIKSQTYSNLELIIADDCSKDNTIEICKLWCDKNKKRFINITILESNENYGVSKNIQKGFEVCKGIYVKAIAADDILIKDSLEANYIYSLLNPEIDILFSNAMLFNDENGKRRELGEFLDNRKKSYFKYNNIKMLNYLYDNYYLCTPTAFIKKGSLDLIGGFVTEYSMFEDFPTWVKALKKNLKFGYLDKITVMYRRESDSITNPKNRVVNEKLVSQQRDFYKKYMLDDLKKQKKIYTIINNEMSNFINMLIIKRGNRVENIGVGIKVLKHLVPCNFIANLRRITKM